MPIDFMPAATALNDRLVAWRRDFHRHPELAFQEKRTAAQVAKELGSLGLKVQTGVGQTGVVGILAGSENGPTILVRFDMDALPIIEQSDVPYRSSTPGIMHACGHDGHTAIGLGVAHLLNQRRSQIHGRIKFVFQPAEETAAGASAMIANGVLNDPVPSIALGLHLWNALSVGQIGLKPGPIMAGADTFEITIRGKGGHGASPHETRDPLLTATHVVTALQSIISRNIDPLDSAVLSVTSFNAGTAFNIIPPEASLKGTIRTYHADTRSKVETRLMEVTHGVASALGCEAELQVNHLTPALVNDPEVTAVVQKAIAPYADPGHVDSSIRTMGAEDMAIFLEHIPGCFVMIGSADPTRGLEYPHHHPNFDFDEAALRLGAAVVASAIAAYVIPD